MQSPERVGVRSASLALFRAVSPGLLFSFQRPAFKAEHFVCPIFDIDLFAGEVKRFRAAVVS